MEEDEHVVEEHDDAEEGHNDCGMDGRPYALGEVGNDHEEVEGKTFPEADRNLDASN